MTERDKARRADDRALEPFAHGMGRIGDVARLPAYEMGMHASVFCSGSACEKRSPLYVGYPLLALVSAMALVQAYVPIRDKRH